MITCALALAVALVPAGAFAAPLSTAPAQGTATEQDAASCPRGYENCPWRESGAPRPQADGSCGGCARGGHGIACPLAWGQNLADTTLERLAPLYALAQNAQTICPADGVNCPRHGDACPNAACPANGIDCPRHGDACPNLANPEEDAELGTDNGAGSNNGAWDCPRNGNDGDTGNCPRNGSGNGNGAGSNNGTWDCPGNGRHGCGRGCR